MIRKNPIRQVVVVLTTAALTMTGTVITTVPASASTVQTATTAAPTTQQIRDYILRQVNEERAKNNLNPVKANTSLDSVAQECSITQRNNNSMAHCDGYYSKYPAGFWSAGENVAYGYDYTEVMAAWMASPGHKANILNKNFTDLGIGYATSTRGIPYYTQNFGGRTTSVPPTPTPNIRGDRPTIVGLVEVGERLEARTPNWTSDVTFTYQWYANGTPIAGANEITYLLTKQEAGKQISVNVRATRAGYNSLSKTSALTAPVVDNTPVPPVEEQPTLPMESSVPEIVGNARTDATVTAMPGRWESGATLKYQWKANNINIVNANQPTYKIQPADVNKTLTVTITGSKTGYYTAVKTSRTVKVSAETLKATYPTISGPARVGGTLTTNIGSWTSGATIGYQWEVDGTPVPGATNNKYVIPSKDYGKFIAVRVTGTKPGYTTSSLLSNSTQNITRGVTTATTPKISGTAKVGSKLTVDVTGWTSGTRLTYQWRANGQEIRGATSNSYTIPANVLGKKISVTVSGTQTNYSWATATSGTVTVARGTLTTGTVKITGTTKTGYTLTANRGNWTSGTNFSYQWYVNGTATKGATKATYKLPSSARGKQISVKITGSKAGYNTVTKVTGKTPRIR